MEPSTASASASSSSAAAAEQPATTSSPPPDPMFWGPDYDTKMQTYIGRSVFGPNHRLGTREIRALLSSYRLSRYGTIIPCLDTTCYSSHLNNLRRQFPQVKAYLIELTAKKKEDDDKYDSLSSSFPGWEAEKQAEDEEVRAVIRVLRNYWLGQQRTFSEIIEHGKSKDERRRARAAAGGSTTSSSPLARFSFTTTAPSRNGRRNGISQPSRHAASGNSRTSGIYTAHVVRPMMFRVPANDPATASIPPNARPGDWFTMSYQGRNVLATVAPPSAREINNADPPRWADPGPLALEAAGIDPITQRARPGAVIGGNRGGGGGNTANLIRELGEMREQLSNMREEADNLSATARRIYRTRLDRAVDRATTAVDRAVGLATAPAIPTSTAAAAAGGGGTFPPGIRQVTREEMGLGPRPTMTMAPTMSRVDQRRLNVAREEQELLDAIERSLVDFSAPNSSGSGGQGSSRTPRGGGNAGDQEPSQSTMPGPATQGDPPAPAA